MPASDLSISTTPSADEKHEKMLSLLLNPELATNGTGSFFGGDRAEVLGTVLEATEAQGVASHRMKEIVRQAVENLKNNPADGQTWVLIKMVIGDLPLYPDLREDFLTVVKSLNIGALIASDPSTATYAVMVAASQLPYYPEEDIRSHLELGWLELVKHYSVELDRDDGTEENGVAVVAMLFEGALGLAIGIIYNKRKYLLGLPVLDSEALSLVDWRNTLFECCDWRTMRPLEGA